MTKKHALVANIVATRPDAVPIADFKDVYIFQAAPDIYKRFWRVRAVSDAPNARVLLYMFFDYDPTSLNEVDEWVEKRGWRIERFLTCGGCLEYDHTEIDYFSCFMSSIPEVECVCAHDCMNNYEPTDDMIYSAQRRGGYVNNRPLYNENDWRY